MKGETLRVKKTSFKHQASNNPRPQPWGILSCIDLYECDAEIIRDAAIASHERIYEIAAGRVAPYNDAPEYLPKLF